MLRLLSMWTVYSLVVSLLVVIFLICVIGRMRMFQKAGVAGWKAFIPFYRDYVLCEITMGKGWYFVFGLIPVLVPLTRALYAIEVTLSFGRETLFAVLYYFFPWACELYLGLSGVTYAGSRDLEKQVQQIFGGDKADPDQPTRQEPEN